MNQKRVHKTPSKKIPSEEEVDIPPSKSSKIEDLKEHTDDLLDEIDEILEGNAQEFVNAYIQKGGQ